MKIPEKYLDETIRAIGTITKSKYNSLISVKKIRKLYKIDPLDHSKINFYWRSLHYLEKHKVIKRFEAKSPKKYQVLNFFKFFELLYDVYDNHILLSKSSD
ncbi:MAG: hypothetical protein ACFFBH_02180 [Promethearchaeota archaeon]